MNQQAKADQPGLWHNTQSPIQQNHPGLMQRMETYTAPIGVVDGNRKKMIYIYQHSGY
jgi:hypothetical protein